MNAKSNVFKARSLAFVLLLCFTASVSAQVYPSKPVKIVVGMAAGGGNDIVARMLGTKIAELSKQAVLIENRPGAGGTIAPTFVTNATPDGYTVLFISASQVLAANLYDKLPYNLATDLEAVTQLTASPVILVISPKLPVKTVRDLIALAKAQPGKLNFASAGEASSTHIAMELFKSMTGTNLVHVPYKGQAPSLVDLIAGRVDVSFAGLVQALPIVRDGRFRALAVTGSKRFPAAPDIPTVAEAGVPGFEVLTWHGVLAPAKTPKDVVGRIHAEFHRALNLPDIRKSLEADGTEVVGSSPAEFEKFLKLEVEKWGKVIKDAKIKLTE